METKHCNDSLYGRKTGGGVFRSFIPLNLLLFHAKAVRKLSLSQTGRNPRLDESPGNVLE
jgi:hypothetical protein